jgi:hypothetical protein
VAPDLDSPGGWLLTIAEVPQSYVDLHDPTHLEFEYVQRLAHLVDLAAAPGQSLSALHLGGGAFTLPRYIAHTRPGSAQRIVELDGALVELVREILPWAPAVELSVTVGDARATLGDQPAGLADLVVADVYAGPHVPAHLTSVEFIEDVDRVLTANGIYVANIADIAPLHFARGQAATVRAVLPHIALVAEPAVYNGRRFGNVLLIGSRRELPVPELRRRLAGDPFPAKVAEGAALHEILAGFEPVTDDSATASPPPPPGAFRVS